MFNKNKTQMMWKAIGGEESGRTISHLDQTNRGLKYNEFDYVKRISVKEFMKDQKKSLSEGRTSLIPLNSAAIA